MKDTRLFKRLFAYMKPYLLRYVVAIVLMIIIVGIDVSSPLLISASVAELGNEVIDFNRSIFAIQFAFFSTNRAAAQSYKSILHIEMRNCYLVSSWIKTNHRTI